MRASVGWGLFVLAVVGCACLVVEHDAPWYLAAGDLILRTGALPTRDPFSFTSTVPWLDHEWLSEVLLALAYRAGGWPALGLLTAVGAAVTIALLVRATRPRGGWDGAAPIVWALLLVVLREVGAPRATLFADLAFAATLALALDEDRPRLWACVPIQLLWTQLHGGNPLGVALLGLRWLTGPTRRRGLVAAACALATLAGPYGARVHAHFLGARAGLPMIREWQPLAAALAEGAVGAWVAFALVAAALAFLAMELRREPRDARARFLLAAVAIFGAAGWRWARFSTEAALVAACALAPGLGARTRVRPVLALPAAAALAVALALAGARRPGLGLDADRFPVEATAWLRAHRPAGPMFNSYNFGGWLLWARPEEPVFVDGRAFTVYAPELLAELPALYAEPRRFDAWVARYGLRLAVLQRQGRGAALDAWLAAQPAWSLAHRDAIADVFVRATP